MSENIFFSGTRQDFKTLIIECVAACLRTNPQGTAPSAQKEHDLLMTVTECAEFLALSEDTIYSLAKSGKIPSIKLPGTKRVYFDREELREFMKKHRSRSAAEAEKEGANSFTKTNRKRGGKS